MEHKFTSYTSGQKQRLTSNNNYTRTTHNDLDRLTTEKNLRNKLDNAFSDLDSLRKSLKDIKGKATITQEKQNILNFSPIHNSRANNYDSTKKNIRSKSKKNSKKILNYYFSIINFPFFLYFLLKNLNFIS